MVEFKRIEKVLKDKTEHDNYKRSAEPRKQTFSVPPYPYRNVSLNPDARASEFGVEQPLLRYYLETAFVSDNPLIVGKLKELIMCVKLTMDSEDPMHETLRRDIDRYYKAVNEHKAKVEEAEAKYMAEYKMYELTHLKKAQDISFYVDDLVEASIKRLSEGRPTVWDTLVRELLEEEMEFKTELGPLEDMLEDFKKYSLNNKCGFIEEVKTKHMDWLDKQIEDRTDDIFDQRGYENHVIEVEAEEFLECFDEDGNPRDEYAVELYEERMCELNSYLRNEARDEAIRQIRDLYYNGADGYDTIYSYDPNCSKRSWQNAA
ncbi:hypothetical protein D3C72_229780 [compost metagenome]